MGLSNSSEPAEPPLDPPLHALAENSLAKVDEHGDWESLAQSFAKSAGHVSVRGWSPTMYFCPSIFIH